ncbi:cystatin-1-like [Amphiura filiformis]|uniref:cystatin-1-like n=1 Tax=Amphiura filiformis TaxID=82378 RepID=UPI003B221D40
MTPSQCFVSVLLLVVLSDFVCKADRIDIDVNDEQVRKVATFAEEEIDARSNSMNLVKLTNIVKAETQILAGILYHLTLEMRLTDCRKGSERDSCKLDTVIHLCKVEILDKPWSKATLEKYSCLPPI